MPRKLVVDPQLQKHAREKGRRLVVFQFEDESGGRSSFEGCVDPSKVEELWEIQNRLFDLHSGRD